MVAKKVDRYSFEYNGVIDFKMADQLLIDIQSQLESTEMPYIVQKGIYSISVESMYNVVDHGLHDFSEDSMMSFKVEEFEKDVKISITNQVSTSDFVGFVSKVNLLNKLDFTQLRKEKLSQIKNGKLSEKGGAGIGLIDIRMKSKNIIQLDYHSIDAEKGMIKLTFQIDKPE